MKAIFIKILKTFIITTPLVALFLYALFFAIPVKNFCFSGLNLMIAIILFIPIYKTTQRIWTQNSKSKIMYKIFYVFLWIVGCLSILVWMNIEVLFFLMGDLLVHGFSF